MPGTAIKIYAIKICYKNLKFLFYSPPPFFNSAVYFRDLTSKQKDRSNRTETGLRYTNTVHTRLYVEELLIVLGKQIADSSYTRVT